MRNLRHIGFRLALSIVLSGCKPALEHPGPSAAADSSGPLDSKAHGIVLHLSPRLAGDETRRELRAGDTLAVSFPSPMAEPADFGKPVAAAPVEFSPALPIGFQWKSATEGELTVQAVVPPGKAHRLVLRTGLRDLAGAEVVAANWGAEWPAQRFRAALAGRRDKDTALEAQPVVVVQFSHPVAATEVARTVVWRDDRGRTQPTEVQLTENADAGGAVEFALSPRAALEPGRRYDLMVEETRCAIDGTRLPFVHVFPLGQTRALRVEWVRAHHQPHLGTFLEIRFDQPLEKDFAAHAVVRAKPAAKITSTTIDGASLRVFGEFTPGVRYTVEVPREAARSRRGFALAEPATWRATFGAKRAAVILPRSILTTPARRGLELEFTQVNTGPLRWQLARVPPEQVIAVRARLDEWRELDETNRDPRTGEYLLKPTRLLVPDLALPVLADGKFDASDGDREVPRTLAFAPELLRGGVYLLELSGRAADGRTAGNRALLLVNREFLVWKRDRTGTHARLFDLETGVAVAGAELRALGADGRLLAEGTTDETGRFAAASAGDGFAPELMLVNRGGAHSAHFTEFAGSLPWDRGTQRAAGWRHWITTDRGLYRPGESIRVKGIVRAVEADALTLPAANAPVAWQVLSNRQREPVISGEATLSATGGWEAEIALPAGLPLGGYTLAVAGADAHFKIDEFRAPAFAVEVHAADVAPDRTSRVRVISHLFHGAPNAGARVRWRALWRPLVTWPDPTEEGPWLVTTDRHSPAGELAPPRSARAEQSEDETEATNIVLEGTATLGADGAAELQSTAPFPAAMRLGAAHVSWEISVVAPDSQAVGAGASQRVPLLPARPAVALGSPREGEVDLAASAVDLNGVALPGTPLVVTLYRVAEKSVREHVSPRVVRYRNTAVHTNLLVREVRAPFREKIAVEGTGRFVAVAELAGVPAAPRASDAAYVSGRAPAEFAQWDDRSLPLLPDRASYQPGDVARLTVRAPFAGRAWVTVETDRVIASHDVVLAGNAATIDIPVTAAMHPNAFVSVHLFRPGATGVPAERLGTCALRVRRPETALQLATELAAVKCEPGETVRGVVTVSLLGQPAARAEVTLFAVDESVLRHGRWSVPDLPAVFFPDRWHGVATTSGLGQFNPRREDEPLFQKGFLLGDGKGGARGNAVRSRFQTLAFWQGAVRADEHGRASFKFKAPDNLTEYRIVAVAQHGVEAFGHNAQHVQVARRLQAEPALPRFVRAGDEVELRVILRQTEWEALPVETACAVEGATLIGEAKRERQTLARALPQVAMFRARVDGDASQLRVRFTVRAADGTATEDAVEHELPVRAATVQQRETIAGTVPAAGWSPAAMIPSTWREARGEVDLLVSRSPWLPVIAGLPALLDYPHGCTEQVSGRVLAYALMGDLLRALPDGESRAPEYRRRVEHGLARLARAQLADGSLAYWPGASAGHTFATIQAAWAVAEAERSGWPAAPALTTGLRRALQRIVRRQDGVRAQPGLRAFALLAAAELEMEPKPRIEALELFQQRDALGDDGRAFLALALHRMAVLPVEKNQLLSELASEPADRVFAPEVFGSPARTAALRLCARAAADNGTWTEPERRRGLAALMCASQDFSTQENLWRLLAFRALVRRETEAVGALCALPWAEPQRSADGRTAGWFARALSDFGREFSDMGALGGEGTFLLRGRYRSALPEVRTDRGFRLERVVQNLTAQSRDGSAAAPFQLGDELAVTFRVRNDRRQAYVALEESLPAAFETVDPVFFHESQRRRLAEIDGGIPLALSHWEKRDDRTLWYFDAMPAGAGSHTVIVRVTTAGRFRWPGATITPMYDARVSGLSDSANIEVK